MERWAQEEISVLLGSYSAGLRANSGGERINPTLQENVLSPSDFAEHVHHVGSSHHELSSNQLISFVWERDSERETNGILHSREPCVHRSSSREGLRLDEAQDCSVITPQHRVLGQCEGCSEEGSDVLSNAIILHKTLPAVCFEKVVVMNSGETSQRRP